MLEKAIRTWMSKNYRRFIDKRTGELDATALVEAWDRETGDGSRTLDPAHPAWDIALTFG